MGNQAIQRYFANQSAQPVQLADEDEYNNEAPSAAPAEQMQDSPYSYSEILADGYGEYKLTDLPPSGIQTANVPAIPAAAPQSASGKYETKAMGSGMESFDKNLVTGRIGGTSLPSTTFYADTPEKQAPYKRNFVDGKLVGPDGTPIDTKGAEAPAAIGAQSGRHIFAMDKEAVSALRMA